MIVYIVIAFLDFFYFPFHLFNGEVFLAKRRRLCLCFWINSFVFNALQTSSSLDSVPLSSHQFKSKYSTTNSVAVLNWLD